MSSLTRSQLKTSSNNTYLTNGIGDITAAEVRTFNDDLIDSLITNDLTASMNVLSSSYAVTASFALNTVAQIPLTSLNAYTASQDTKNSTLGTYTGSIDTKWNTLGGQTGSFVTESESGSFLITASVSLNTITFTKGNNTTFAVTVNTGSAGGATDISSLNAYTASQDTKNTTLSNVTASLQGQLTNIGSQTGSFVTETESGSFLITASVNLNTITFTKGNNTTFAITVNTGSGGGATDISSLNAYTASQDTKNLAVGYSTSSLNSFTASNGNTSLNSYTASNDTKWSNLGSQSGSFVTESETGSFARTNVDNNFSVNQTFTNITAVSASFQYVQTTFETASVIYSSGSNQFGDAINDVQTLIGTVIVSGSQKITGSLDVSSTFTSSLQSGYVLVGNGSGRTIAVPTSSIGTVTDLTSLNAYTASNDTKWNTISNVTSSLIQATGSYAVKNLTNVFTAIQSFSASLEITGSSPNIKSGSFSGSLITNLTDVYTDVSAVNQIVTLTSASYAGLASGSLTNPNTLYIVSGSTAGGASTDISLLNAFTASQETKNLAVGYSTSSLNAFTSSQETKNSTLATYTASVDTKFTAVGASTSSLNSATASLFTSASLGLTTASFSGNTLTFTKGNGTTFGIVIPDVSGSGGTFATLGANTFTGSQTISSSLNVSGSANFVGGDVNFTDQGRDINIDVDRTIIKGQKPTLISSSLDIQGSLTASLANGFAWVGDATNHNVLVATSSFATTIPTGTISGSSQITALGFVSSSVTASSLITGSVAGNVLTFTKGNNTTFNLTIETGSAGAPFPFNGNAVITGSLLVSGSTSSDITIGKYPGAGIRISSSKANFAYSDGIIVTPHSMNTTYTETPSALKVFAEKYTRILSAPDTGSSPILTNNFNITRVCDSATFGEWTLVGYGTDLYNSGNAGGIYIGKGQPDSSTTRRHTIGFNYIPSTTSEAYNFVFAGQSTYDKLQGGARTGMLGHLFVSQSFTASIQEGYTWVGNSTGYGVPTPTSSFGGGGATNISSLNAYTASQDTKNSTLSTYTASIDTKFSTIGTQSGSWENVPLTSLNSFTASQETKDTTLASVTSSLNAYTASNDTKWSTLSNVTSSLIQATGSYATTGSNVFVGNQTITGSLILSSSATVELTVIGNMVVTGSAFGNVVSMSIASSTASLNLNTGNYFTLSIPTGTTRISPSNIQPGTTATLVITTASGSLVTFDSSVKQPSGSAYVPTSGSVDVLSFVSVNSSSLFVVSTKNMI